MRLAGAQIGGRLPAVSSPSGPVGHATGLRPGLRRIPQRVRDVLRALHLRQRLEPVSTTKRSSPRYGRPRTRPSQLSPRSPLPQPPAIASRVRLWRMLGTSGLPSQAAGSSVISAWKRFLTQWRLPSSVSSPPQPTRGQLSVPRRPVLVSYADCSHGSLIPRSLASRRSILSCSRFVSGFAPLATARSRSPSSRS